MQKGGSVLEKINSDIKSNNYENIYLLYGDEEYLKRQYKNRLKEAIIDKDDTLNFSYFEGKDANSKEIIENLKTMPFFSDRKLMIIKNSGFFKKANDDFFEFIDNIPEYNIIIFLETEVDKRSKIYKKVKTKGYECEFVAPNEGKLVSWIATLLKKEGKKILAQNASYLVNMVGNNMDMLNFEVEKLISYSLDDEEITREMIDEICYFQVSGKIFDMIEAFSNKEQKKAINLYYDLLATKEPPLKILSLIIRQLNLILQLKDLEKRNNNLKERQQIMGIAPFIYNKIERYSKQFDITSLKKAINKCVETEFDIKSGRINDVIGVELLILEYSS